jgi:hypothetical protein
VTLPSIGSTSPPDLVPDLRPGAGQARDDALNAAAEATTNVRELPPAGPSASERDAYEALGPHDAEEARARATEGRPVWTADMLRRADELAATWRPLPEPGPSEREAYEALGPEAPAAMPHAEWMAAARAAIHSACVRCGGSGFVAVDGGYQACTCTEEPAG